jgi:hypothetical protein
MAILSRAVCTLLLGVATGLFIFFAKLYKARMLLIQRRRQGLVSRF